MYYLMFLAKPNVISDCSGAYSPAISYKWYPWEIDMIPSGVREIFVLQEFIHFTESFQTARCKKLEWHKLRQWLTKSKRLLCGLHNVLESLEERIHINVLFLRFIWTVLYILQLYHMQRSDSLHYSPSKFAIF